MAGAGGDESVDEAGAHAGGHESAEGPAIAVHAVLFELEDVLHGDDVALHALHLGDVGDFARAAGESSGLDDDVDGGRELLADGPRGQLEPRHHDHGLDTLDGVAR